MLEGRPKNPKYASNKNVRIVGGSGSGKTRFFLKPNLMQNALIVLRNRPKGVHFIKRQYYGRVGRELLIQRLSPAKLGMDPTLAL